MTEQEIFDKVWIFLNIQGVKSHSPEMGCQYRTENGLACAVGCLLDDETAFKFDTLTVSSISGISRYHPEFIPDTLRPHISFLQELQNIHDNSTKEYWLKIWREEMFQFATDRELTVPPIP